MQPGFFVYNVETQYFASPTILFQCQPLFPYRQLFGRWIW